MEDKTISELVTIIIPARTNDYLVNICVKKIRELYKTVKIVLILDDTEKSPITDENTVILKSDSLTISAKRNKGVKISQTKYVAMIDSDAYPNKNWLENAISFLEINSEYSAVTGCQFNPPEDNFIQICLRRIRFNHLFTHQEWCKIIDFNSKEQDCTEFMTSNVIIRKSDYENLNGMNEKIYIAEDNEFSERLIKNGYKIRFIPKVSVFHRESTMYPFFRKIYCMGYYYANMCIKKKPVKNFKQSIIQFFPLFGILIFCFVWMLFLYLKINPAFLLILPMFVIFILFAESVKEALKLEKRKFTGFFIFFFSFCLFCMVWVISTFCGLINFPSQNIQTLYKQY